MNENNNTDRIKDMVGINKEGWFCLVHRQEGWYVGTDEGVLCYEDDHLAEIARNIVAAMDKKAPGVYKVEVFSEHDGKPVRLGDHTTELSGEEAIHALETRIRK